MYEAIAQNKRRSILLIAGAILLLGAVGFALGYLFSSGIAGLIVAVVIAAGLSIGSYRYGDRVVLASTRAREVTQEQEPRLHNVVEGISLAAGIPKPRVYVVPSTTWRNASPPFTDRDNVGKASEPEYGISLARASLPALERYAWDERSAKGYFK